jgi:site-specific recombinase XerD
MMSTPVPLAELLRATLEPFLELLARAERSPDYLRTARRVLAEFADFCERAPPASAWDLRQRYLEQRAELRAAQPFTHGYLIDHGRELQRCLRVYQAEAHGAPPSEWLPAYLGRAALSPSQHRIVRRHFPRLGSGVGEHALACGDPATLVAQYFAARQEALRGDGYGQVLTHRAGIVTRRYLAWLEAEGHLPATPAGELVTLPRARGERDPAAIARRWAAQVPGEMPTGLRTPLLTYLQQLLQGPPVTESTLRLAWRTSLALCRQLVAQGQGGFAALRVAQVDAVVAALVSAPPGDLLRRRQQVQQRHSALRGFLRYLHRAGWLNRDLAAVLVSPPCYRDSRPPAVLAPEELQTLLAAVDRDRPGGRLCYAILLLLTTYGLRPVDVAALTLDDLHWRAGRLALVQQKTGVALTLPLLPEVVAALYAYLRRERAPLVAGVTTPARRLFLARRWPHRPLSARGISDVVRPAFVAAGLPHAQPRQLRASCATALLRQGVELSTIQAVLGHRTPDRTQRYAVTDLVLLRQVLEEFER